LNMLGWVSRRNRRPSFIWAMFYDIEESTRSQQLRLAWPTPRRTDETDPIDEINQNELYTFRTFVPLPI